MRAQAQNGKASLRTGNERRRPARGAESATAGGQSCAGRDNVQPLAGDWLRRLRRRLLAWYRREARDLPWRRSRDPYHVWLSEIMLQQTQVATVERYFNRFVDELPTLAALAAADEQQVLRLWEGLGYYRRARQLHHAAGIVVAQHGGQLPSDPALLSRLPGIGRYTAGAILSIAFGQRQPILEANTIRLYSRLAAFRGDPHTAAGGRLLWQVAEALLPQRGSGELNQALMELGATVCTPQRPKCEACPVAALCPTHRLGLQSEIPRPKRPPRFEAVREAAVVVLRGNRVLLRRCGDGERWAGLWDFVRMRIESEDPDRLAEELAAGVRRLTGLVVRAGERLATIKHGVTRFRITLVCHRARYVGGALARGGEMLRWVEPAALDDYPLSTTARKLGRIVRDLARGARD